MSLKKFNTLIQVLMKGVHVADDADVVIHTMTWDEKAHTYEIELTIQGTFYVIQHFEPLHPTPGVNYGEGKSFCYYRFDYEYGCLERFHSKELTDALNELHEHD